MNIGDTFNRADASLGTSSDGTFVWSPGNLEIVSGSSGNQATIVSNQCKQGDAASIVSIRADVALTNDDNYAQITVVTRGTGDGCGVYCRASTGTNPSYYIAYLPEASNNVQLYKNTGGASFTQLGSNVAVTVSLPQTLRVQAIGTTIKVFWDGVEKISVTDSAITTGTRTGIRIGAGGTTRRVVDDFRAGDAPEVLDAVYESFGVVIG